MLRGGGSPEVTEAGLWLKCRWLELPDWLENCGWRKQQPLPQQPFERPWFPSGWQKSTVVVLGCLQMWLFVTAWPWSTVLMKQIRHSTWNKCNTWKIITIPRHNTIQSAVYKVGWNTLSVLSLYSFTFPRPLCPLLEIVLLYLGLFIPNGSYSRHASCKQ